MIRQRPSIHPGEILLEEFVKPLGLTQKQLCGYLGIGIKTISEIYNKKRGITPLTALKPAVLSGAAPEFRLNAQNAYEAYLKEKENIDMIKKIA